MDKKYKRFLKLEHSSGSKISRKKKKSFQRFAHLEVEGHKIEIGIEKPKKSGPHIILCPQCRKKNAEDSAYCIYCAYVFKKSTGVGSDTEVKPWEVKCGACGKIGNRNQDHCFYCGRALTDDPTDALYGDKERAQGRAQGPADKDHIVIKVDGRYYSSASERLPPDIQELMRRIRRQGYSQVVIDGWFKQRDSFRKDGAEWGHKQGTFWIWALRIALVIMVLMGIILVVNIFF